MRLDQYLAEHWPERSRSTWKKLIKDGRIEVDGAIKTSPKAKITEDSIVKPQSIDEKHGELDIPILYEDEDVIVINKPSGVLSHSKDALDAEPTVASWLSGKIQRSKYKDQNTREGIVHRLDRDTSGVMILAKNMKAQEFLQKQFSTRKAKKTYLAVVNPAPKQDEAIIDMPIERNPKKPATFRVGANGKLSKTYYKVLKAGDKTIVELMPETGRTHQLRVHMKHLGSPIIGDVLYGGEPSDRLMLHAQKLEITLPNGKKEVFEPKVPKEFLP